MSAQLWGIIGFGEAGSTFASHLSRQSGCALVITDPVLNQKDRPESFRRRLNGITAQIVPDIPALMRSSDVSLSLVTPRVALDVARTAAAFWEKGLYVDLNSVSPVEKQQMAALFPPGVFVGGAILGSIAGEGAASKLVLDGPSADRAHALLQAGGFNSTAISEILGSAAALKLCRSIFMKGIECILVEALLAGSSFKIADSVLESIESTLNTFGFRPMVEMLVTTHAAHCARRADEMRQVAAMLAELKLPNVMSDASREFLCRSSSSGIIGNFEGAAPERSSLVIDYLKHFYVENQ
jgi:3-hydroxyisobutyrate dehydrogenase-like beta-hydroxyacid dehydrogenase